MVPPNQSEMMAEAVRKKGLKVKYVTFEGEQHGFRKAENIIRSLEEELAFYQDVFACTSTDRAARSASRYLVSELSTEPTRSFDRQSERRPSRPCLSQSAASWPRANAPSELARRANARERDT